MDYVTVLERLRGFICLNFVRNFMTLIKIKLMSEQEFEKVQVKIERISSKLCIQNTDSVGLVIRESDC